MISYNTFVVFYLVNFTQVFCFFNRQSNLRQPVRNEWSIYNEMLKSSTDAGLIFTPYTVFNDPTSSFQLNSIGMPRVLPPTNQDNFWQLWFHGRDSKISSDVVNLSTGRIFYATSLDGVSKWKIHPDNPVMSPSKEEGNWWWFDSEHVGLGDVITPGRLAQSKFIMDSGIYLMYIFGGSQNTVVLKDNVVKGTKMEIGVAVSQDGINWSRIEGPFPHGAILEPGEFDDFDGQFVGWPNVVEVGTEYRMYYNTYDPKLKKFIVGVAIAKDGLRWNKIGPVFSGTSTSGQFDSMGASRRHVLRLENGQYRMWYEGLSSDGVHSIGLATSADGLRWDRVSDSPVFTPSLDPNAWDSGGVGSPHLIWLADKQRWRMYYVGTPLNPLEGSEVPIGSIGIAESLDADGLSFNRVTV